jgi:hypothetical protein
MRLSRSPTSAALALLLLAAVVTSLRTPTAAGPVCHDRNGDAVAPNQCLVDDYSTGTYTHTPAPGAQGDLNPGLMSPRNEPIQDLTVYTVFWLPSGQHYYDPVNPGSATDAAFEQTVNQWVQDVGGTPYYNMVTQYFNQSSQLDNSVTFGGSYVDVTPYPHDDTQFVTDNEIMDEVQRAVASNPSWRGGLDHVVAVFTANGMQISLNGKDPACGYHLPFTDDAGTLHTYIGVADNNNCSIYPSANGPVDAQISQLSHEVFEDVTDPVPFSTPTWVDNNAGEIGDKCINNDPTPQAPENQAGADVYLHGHPYTLQQEWSNAVHTCAIDYCPSTGVCQPSITMQETAPDATPVEYTEQVFTVLVTNTSDTAAATNVTISGTVPAGYSIIKVMNKVVAPTSSFSVPLSYLPVHGTQEIQLHVTVGQAGYFGTSCPRVTYSDLLGGHTATIDGTQCAHTTPTGVAATGWDNTFANYGDARHDSQYQGQWNGGDAAESTPLPNGDTAWFFNDSFYGQVGLDGIRTLFSNSQPRNMIVIQHGTSLTQSIAGPVNSFLNPNLFPGTLVAPPDPYSDQNHYNLTGGDGMMVGNTLYKFYTVMDATGGNSAFPDQPVDTAVASFTWTGSTLTLSSVQVIPFYSAMVSWGIALLNDGGYTYIYGVEDQGFSTLRNLHIARVPQGQLTNWNAWEFRTDTGWSSSSALSAAIMPYSSEGFSVTNVNGTYVLLTNDTNPNDGNPWSAVAYYASTPDGFANATYHFIYAPPLRSGLIAYEYRIHPEFSTGSKVLIGYSVNTLNMDLSCMSENTYDATIYRPHFIALQLPGIGGPVGTVTANNTALSRSPEFPSPKPVPPSAEVWHVTDPAPDSWSSTECSVTNPTPAPAPNLTASSNSDASISLHWTVSPTAMWVYNLQYHDDTADPNDNQPPSDDPNCAQENSTGGWCTFPYPLVAINDMTMQFLHPEHTYRYRVQAGKWRSSGATWSSTVWAVAYLAPPTGQPFNVHASSGSGSVTITWDDANPNAWFKIVYRGSDGVRNETYYPTPNRSFTWNLPAGSYAFTVVEYNDSGEGPESQPPVNGVSL